MRYLELIMNQPLIWGLFIAYLLLTSWLAYLGHKKTGDIKSFALGKGNMNPLVVGITLAASIASVATFVLNPGFVYVHGFSALLHLGGAAGFGLITGLFVMSFRFQSIGQKTKALTLPQWIGTRYDSQAMTIFFAAVNLLSLTFVVAIVGGLSIVMQLTLGLSNMESILLIIGFVFSYIFIGGTYAHAYTNTLQGIVMTVIAAIIVFSGLPLLFDSAAPLTTQLAAINPDLIAPINPSSNLFGSFFSIYVAGFAIGFALVCQPHIMIKALYVESKKEIWQYLGVYLFVSLFFTGLLLVGLYAHLSDIPTELFLDPTTGAIRQDQVLTIYVTETFSPVLIAIISVALLAAGMSTLDGILIALSSIAANDLFLNLTRNNFLKDFEEEHQFRIAHKAGQIILILMGVLTFALAINPPALLSIFGQVGVYAIVSASCAPILFGVLVPGISSRAIFTAALVGLGTHIGLYLWGSWATGQGISLNEVVASRPVFALFFDTEMIQLGFANPGVTATYGLIASFLIAIPAAIYSLRSKAQPANEQ